MQSAVLGGIREIWKESGKPRHDSYYEILERKDTDEPRPLMSNLSRDEQIDTYGRVLTQRQRKVLERDAKKVIARERVTARLRGHEMSADKMLGLDPGTIQSRLPSFKKHLTNAVRGAGIGGCKGLAHMDSAVKKGRTFKNETCAGSIRSTAAGESLKEASYCWQSDHRVIWEKAAVKARAYLSLVPRGQYTKIGHYAGEVCQVILREVDLRVEEYKRCQEDPRTAGKRWTDWKIEPELVDFATFKQLWCDEVCPEDAAANPDDELLWCRPWMRMPQEEYCLTRSGLPEKARTLPIKGKVNLTGYSRVFVGRQRRDPNGKELWRMTPEINDRVQCLQFELPERDPHGEGIWQGDGSQGYYVMERPTREMMELKGPVGAFDPETGRMTWHVVDYPWHMFHRDHGTKDVKHFRRLWPEVGDYTDWTANGPDHEHLSCTGEDMSDEQGWEFQWWSETRKRPGTSSAPLLPKIHPWEKAVAEWKEMEPDLYQLQYKKGHSPAEREATAKLQAKSVSHPSVAQSSGARADPVPPTDADTLDVEHIRKAWKSKDFCIVMERLSEEQVNVSVWEMSRHYKEVLRQQNKRLKAMYLNKDSASKLARSQTMATSDSFGLIKEERAKEQPGMSETHAERSELTGAQREAERKVEEAAQKQRLAHDKRTATELLGPGAWFCKRCKNALSAEQADCPNYVKASEVSLTPEETKRRVPGDQKILCRGSQNTTWGGYVHTIDKVVPANLLRAGVTWRGNKGGKKYGNVESEARRGNVKDRVLAKTLTADEISGIVTEERKEAVERALHCHKNIVERRERKRARVSDEKQKELKADPDAWACAFCWLEDEDGNKTDVYNFGNRSRCFKCSKDRSDDWRDQYRWLCPECSNTEYTIPGSEDECPDCGQNLDWKKFAYCELPKALADATPSGRQATEMSEYEDPIVRMFPKKKRKRGGQKHKKASKSHHAEDTGDEGEDEADHWQPPNDPDEDQDWEAPRRGGGGGGGRRFITSIIALSLIQGADAAGIELGAVSQLGGLAVLLSAVFLGHRTYLTADKVIEAAGNKTVEVVHAFGDASISLVPVFLGFVLTIVLLVLKYWMRVWRVPERPPTDRGGRGREQQPIGDVQAELTTKFPFLPFLSQDFLARVVANVADAARIALDPESITRIHTAADRRLGGQNDLTYAITSGGLSTDTRRRYTVTIARYATFIAETSANVIARDLITCTCPGHNLALVRAGDGRICKHAGAVLMASMKEHVRKHKPYGPIVEGRPIPQDGIMLALQGVAESSQPSGARTSVPPASAAPSEPALTLTNELGPCQTLAMTQAAQPNTERFLAEAQPFGLTGSPAEYQSLVRKGKQRLIFDHKHLNDRYRPTHDHVLAWPEGTPLRYEAGPSSSRALADTASRASYVVATDSGREMRGAVLAFGPPIPADDGLRDPDPATLRAAVRSVAGREFREALYDRLYERELQGNDGKAVFFRESLLKRDEGNVVAFMNSKQTVAVATFLIGEAEANVFLTCFTFDLGVIADALQSAANRGVEVTVVADRQHTFKGSTQQQLDRLSCLDDKGVKVVLATGLFGGIQHSKTLIVDNALIIGSTNWTTSSLTNSECSTLIELDKGGLKQWNSWKQEVIQKAQSFKECVPPDRSKAAVERFRTAKRFSLARARSADARLAYGTDR